MRVGRGVRVPRVLTRSRGVSARALPGLGGGDVPRDHVGLTHSSVAVARSVLTVGQSWLGAKQPPPDTSRRVLKSCARAGRRLLRSALAATESFARAGRRLLRPYLRTDLTNHFEVKSPHA